MFRCIYIIFRETYFQIAHITKLVKFLIQKFIVNTYIYDVHLLE